MYSDKNDIGFKLKSNIRYLIHKEVAKIVDGDDDDHNKKKKPLDLTLQSIVIEA